MQRQLEVKISIPNTTPAAALINWSGTVYPVGGIAGGTLLNQRVGADVTFRRLEFIDLWYGNAGATVPSTGRVIIFLDTMNPGTAPTASEVLDISLLGTVGAPLAAYNAFNRAQKRFRILYDKLTSCNNGAYSVEGQTNANIAKKKLTINTVATFSGSGATTYGKNSLWMLAVSDVNVNDPSLYLSAELFFTDA